MLNLYNKNGLIFWTEEQIKVRQMFVDRFVFTMGRSLKSQNRAFEMIQCEAPLLTPQEYINPNYGVGDMYVTLQIEQEPLVCRPETTMGSYEFAKYLLDHHTGTRLPICVWQHGKSFRREQDQPTKHMRLKEFYQLEFQCLYGMTTANDYQPLVLEALLAAFTQLLGPCKVEASDRLPDYSESTVDIVYCKTGMELASISKRKDFTGNVYAGQNKVGLIQSAKCLEVAIGTDRCMANFLGLLKDE
jgi:glycyl-tRNA synthetase